MRCIYRKKDNTKNNEEWKNLHAFFSYAKSNHSPLFSLMLSLCMVNTLIGIIYVFIPKIVLSTVRSYNKSLPQTIVYIILIEGFVVSIKIISTYLNSKVKLHGEKLFRAAYRDLGVTQSKISFEKSLTTENLNDLESCKYGVWEIPAFSDNVIKLGSSGALLLFNAVLICVFDWKYLLIPVITIIIYTLLYRFIAKIEIDNVQRLLPENRAFGWYCRLITDIDLGEELRILQGDAFIVKQCKKLMEKIYRTNQKAYSKKGLLLGFTKILLQMQILLIAILFVRNNRINLSSEDFVLIFSAISSFSIASNDIVSGIPQTKKIGALLKPLFTFLDDNRNPDQVNFDAGINKVTTLRVENLSYSYPNSTTPAIENISFELKTGDKIAIVGLNGAGKSTLIKLICGLLKPSSGYIYFNDKDIISLNDEEFTRYVTILFQDYQLLPTKVIENVACKTLETLTPGDREKFNDLITEANSIKEWLYSFPSKEEVFLSPVISEDYVNPSGGQEQMIAFMRALFKSSSICLMDEPTTSLDSQNGNNILKMLQAIDDKICIMISHRLSQTKFFDRIFVMKDGTIVETGTHEELISKNGLYKQMYSKQAKKYGIDL